ncbi:MAG TPA: DUF4861 family protein [Tepidisphaeraceae bacterium]|jgi:hypothetical protein
MKPPYCSHARVLVALSVLLLARSLQAADWYKFGNVTFPERRTITVANATDAPVNGMPVRVELEKLKVAEDARGTAVVVDPEAKPAREGEMGGALVPHQVVKNVLTFSATLKPTKTKTFYLYTTAQEISGVSFKPQTSADIRPNHAYRSFENNKMGFRVEVGEGANTTGMAIDLFGKTKAGQQMGAILASRIYKSDYHEMQDWGIDILKIGSSPGLGGVYVIDGEQMGRNNFATTSFEVVEGEKGPILTRVRVHGPVEVNGKKFEVVRTMTLTADDRGIDDVVEMQGEAKALEGIKLGLGVRNLPKESWNEDPKMGFAFVDGDGNQKGTEHLGMGVAFKPEQYVRTDEIKTVATATSPSVVDPVNGGHIVVLTPTAKEGKLTSRHHLGAYWNGDGEIAKKEDFQAALVNWAKLLVREPKVEVGQPEHAK